MQLPSQSLLQNQYNLIAVYKLSQHKELKLLKTSLILCVSMLCMLGRREKKERETEMERAWLSDIWIREIPFYDILNDSEWSGNNLKLLINTISCYIFYSSWYCFIDILSG